jgi:hypothetical protein
LLALALAAFALIAGCNSETTSGGIILAQGTKTIATGADEILADVTVSEPGTLRGTITWSGPPTEMAVLLLHVTPSDMLGITFSNSPTISTVAVTSARVAAGHEWRFVGTNPNGPDVSVSYTVTFVPD